MVSGVETEETKPEERGGLLYPLTKHNTTDRLEHFEAALVDKLNSSLILLGGEVFDMEEAGVTHEFFSRSMNQVGETVTRVMEEAVGVAEKILAVHPPSGGNPPVHYGNIWLSRAHKRDRWRTMKFIKRANTAVVVFHEQPIDK